MHNSHRYIILVIPLLGGCAGQAYVFKQYLYEYKIFDRVNPLGRFFRPRYNHVKEEFLFFFSILKQARYLKEFN